MDRYSSKYFEFFTHFNVTEDQMSELWEIFMEHGMTRGEAEHRTKGNHYFLQALCQYHSVEWKTWNKKLSNFVRIMIKNKYPQFMVEDKSFEIN